VASILSLSTFLIVDFGIVPTVWYFLFSFHFSTRAISYKISHSFTAISEMTNINLLQLFSDNLAVVLDFLILQDKNKYTYIVVKYKINLRLLRSSVEMLAFLPISKARTNKFYIFRQWTYFLYIHA
jgi:hypothetical protein